MGLPTLPFEIWIEIGGQDVLHWQTYYTLVLVCKQFYDIFTPLLYKHPVFDLDAPIEFPPAYDKTSKYELGGPSLQHLLEGLEANSSLRRHVTACSVSNLHYKLLAMYSEDLMFHRAYIVFINDVFKLIGSFPRLEEIYIRDCGLTADVILFLASRPNLNLAIDIARPCGIWSVTEGCERLWNAETDTFTAWFLKYDSEYDERLDPLIFSNSLEEADLACTDFGTLVSRLEAQGMRSLTHLKALTTRYTVARNFEFLNYIPNLREITLKQAGGGRDPMGYPASNMLIPNLWLFDGPNVLLPHFTAGRPVTSIRCWDLDHRSIFKELGRHFGSGQPVNVVKWGDRSGRSSPEDLIHYLVDQNPEVRYLVISDKYVPRNDLRGILTEEEAIHWIEQFERLKNLKVLRCHAFRYGDAQKDPIWQKAQCERLHTNGCRNIVEISFMPRLVWRRKPNSLTWQSYKR